MVKPEHWTNVPIKPAPKELITFSLMLEGWIKEVSIQPSEKKDFFRVTIDSRFICYIKKDELGWVSLEGQRSELITNVGRELENFLINR
jgi:hypothetical protein